MRFSLKHLGILIDRCDHAPPDDAGERVAHRGAHPRRLANRQYDHPRRVHARPAESVSQV